MTMKRGHADRRWRAASLALALIVAACSGPVLANAPAAHPVAPPTPTPGVTPTDPQPVLLPADDAPHDRMTEWWYETGHLVDEAGGHWGFEDVIFRAERGGFPVTWASHLALTDESGGSFHYAQRSEIGPQVDRGGSDGYDLALDGGASQPGAADRVDPAITPWTMSGGGGRDTLAAHATAPETMGDPVDGFGLDLRLAATKPAALHHGDGWIDFGPAGGSYYYSRTAMVAQGTITVGARTLRVTGSAWFDHQWGDFISVGGGGWDWFAINLDDGTDLTLSLVRAADGSYPLVYGTLVDADGRATNLDRSAFEVAVLDRWTSPATGAVYPARWRITVPGRDLQVELAPTVAQQELDTRATTGVVYWEGSQRVNAIHDGRQLGGQAYVELTGYATAR